MRPGEDTVDVRSKITDREATSCCTEMAETCTQGSVSDHVEGQSGKTDIVEDRPADGREGLGIGIDGREGREDLCGSAQDTRQEVRGCQENRLTKSLSRVSDGRARYRSQH